MSGEYDVDGMLDRITPEAFDEWVAWRIIRPHPLDRIAEILKIGFACLANGWGAKLEPEHFEPPQQAYELQSEKHETGSPNAAAAFVKANYGHGNR